MSKTIKRKLLKSSGVRKTEKAVCPIEKSDRLLFYPEQVKQSVFIKDLLQKTILLDILRMI